MNRKSMKRQDQTYIPPSAAAFVHEGILREAGLDDRGQPIRPCPFCKAFHGIPPLEHLKPGEDCGFDPKRSCDLCGKPVKALSMGGPRICPKCDTGN
jgi:hypothetical protein